MRTALTFDDVTLLPRYSTVLSRDDVDLHTYIVPYRLRSLPIVAAPMDTITETAMAVALAKNGGLGILHRRMSVEDQVKMFTDTQSMLMEHSPVELQAAGYLDYNSLVGVAVGVGAGEEERIRKLFLAKARIFCIDVAHGHHVSVKDTITWMRSKFGGSVDIIVGSICTYAGARDLIKWGADALRVGVGPGAVCSTRVNTGHGVPQISAIMEARKAIKEANEAGERDITLIADGGIRTSGDIVKALASGADAVMLGSLLAGTDETPGEVVNGFKTYKGMASAGAQQELRGEVKHVEGVSAPVPCRGPVEGVLNRLAEGVRSGLSYSGAHCILELQDRAQFCQVSQAGFLEGTPHFRG